MFLEELKTKYALGCGSGGVSSVNMASAKKKLDEYHLKVLRQLVTLPANKECFDCHQRGPTYVNATIGSFVCTSCSGMLRGLTPPHRVKSISMATFTPDEVDFVKARGNDFCRKTWLGLLDTQPPTKDEQQIKDFMIAKYERKRYYIDQSMASTLTKTVNGSTPSPSKSASSVESAHAHTTQSHAPLATVHPHPTTLAFKPQPPAPQSTTVNNAFTPEPFADFSKMSVPPPRDPFNSSQSAAVPCQPSFANFDNNPVFNGSNSTGMPGVGESASVPGEDRYAALKDLDCLMKSQQQQQQQVAETAPADWNPGTNGMPNVWSAPSLFPAAMNQTKDATTTSNPFKANGAFNNVNGMSANPFRNNRPLSTEGIWSCGSNSQMTNGFTTSQSLNFAAQKVPWSNEAVNNPFVLGNSAQTAGLHSSNPFL